MAVANPGKAHTVELSLDRDRLDLGEWLAATEMLTMAPVPQVGEVLRLRTQPGASALVLVRAHTAMEADDSHE